MNQAVNPAPNSNIIKMSINGKRVILFMLRDRKNTSADVYMKLVNSLIHRMTLTQIEGIIETYNGTNILLLDNVLKSFQYIGEIDNDNGHKRCICSVKIDRLFLIVNRETRISYNIGSTCCLHWRRNTHTKHKADRSLRNVFQALKLNYLSAPKMSFGKYKGERISKLVKRQRSYIHWVQSKWFADGFEAKMETPHLHQTYTNILECIAEFTKH
jgi:uncharacterized protein (DUF3820 family)